MDYRNLIIVLFLNVHLVLSDESYITQTVYGFLDFTTTIGNTVMVFSPQSAPALGNIPTNIIETKPFSNEFEASEKGIKPTKLVVSAKLTAQSSQKDAAIEKKQQMVNSFASNSSDEHPKGYTIKSQTVKSFDESESTAQVQNSLYEYDLLSREPAEYAEETYRVINVKSNRNRNNPRRTYESIYTESSVVSAVTTNDVKVKGPPNPGRHSQAQHSSPNAHKNKKLKIRPTSSIRVLKTASPLAPRASAHEQGFGRQPVSKLQSGKSFRPTDNYSVVTPESDIELSQSGSHKKHSRNKSKRKNKNARTSTTHKTSQVTQTASADHNTRKSFRAKVKPSNIETESSTSLYMFKLNRTPGRWQYKTTPKPRVTIRKLVENASESSISNITKHVTDSISGNPNQNSITDKEDLESSGSQNGAVINDIEHENNPNDIVETLNVEISTPIDFKDTYYELITIKTPYAFQVGGLKKTRFITVTSTMKKTITPEPTLIMGEEPLTENVLSPSPREIHLLRETEIATLKAIHIADKGETPSLETVVESFSTSQKKLRTQVLPIVYDYKNETSYLRLVHTYDVTSLITVTKTISPLETEQFIPSRSFKDFGTNLDEAGSEINLELEFGDTDNAEDANDDKPFSGLVNLDTTDLIENRSLNHSIVSANISLGDFRKLEAWNIQNGSPIVTPYLPELKPEKTVPFPSIPTPASINPFLLPVQHFQTITSSLIQQTIVTKTNSKVLKLTFGARTAYTTLFSSEIVPTMLTMYITTSIPVQPTPAFPGYFPPAYPQFAYIG